MNITTNNNISHLGNYADLNLERSAKASPTPEASSFSANLTIGAAATSAVDQLDAVDPAVEAALTRTDDLGVLMGKAFNYQAPPMPDFS